MSEHNIRGLLAPEGEKEEEILWKNMKFGKVIGQDESAGTSQDPAVNQGRWTEGKSIGHCVCVA